MSWILNTKTKIAKYKDLLEVEIMEVGKWDLQDIGANRKRNISFLKLPSKRKYLCKILSIDEDFRKAIVNDHNVWKEISFILRDMYQEVEHPFMIENFKERLDILMGAGEPEIGAVEKFYEYWNLGNKLGAVSVLGYALSVLESKKEMTKREQAIYILGMLGYRMEDLENALKLLEENTLQDIVDFYYSLEIYNAENETCSKISLAGSYPALKIKDGDWDEVLKIMTEHNINL